MSESGLTTGCCVTTNDEDQFWCVSSKDVQRIDPESGSSIASFITGGLPSDITVSAGGTAYVADMEHRAILRIGNDGVETMVKDYEGAALLGPSSIVSSGNMIYFTDSGPLGESTIERPKGSVYCIERDANHGQLLKILASKCLAHPCGICVDGLHIYVAEMLANRILRFTRRPNGAHLMSVLHHFSGRLGPSAIACDTDTGLLYVARFEFDSSTPGLVSVIDPSGANGGHVRDIEIPELDGCEITGLTLHHETKTLYIFEASRGKVVKLEL